MERERDTESDVENHLSAWGRKGQYLSIILYLFRYVRNDDCRVEWYCQRRLIRVIHHLISQLSMFSRMLRILYETTLLAHGLREKWQVKVYKVCMI